MMSHGRRTVVVMLSVLGLAASSRADARSAAEARSQRVAAALAADPGAVPQLSDWGRGLKWFDIRVGADGTPMPAVQASLAALKGSEMWATRHTEVATLSKLVPGLTIDEHEFFGTPQFVRSTESLLSAGSGPGHGAEEAVRAFARRYPALAEFTPEQLGAARVDRRFTDDHSGITHLTYQQLVRVSAGDAWVDLELVGCLVRASVTREGALACLSSGFLGAPVGPEMSAFAISPGRAVVKAAEHAGVKLSAEPSVTGLGRTAMSFICTTPAELREDEAVVAEAVLFPVTREDIRPAYRVVVPVRGVGHTYEIIVDARDGSLLHRHNRLVWDTMQPITMRVFTRESPAPMLPGLAAPSDAQPPFVDRELITIRPEQVRTQSPNGWIDDNAFDTAGNNVDAHLDLDQNNIADFPRPNGGVNRVFDFPLDPTLAPSTYRDAAVTQMFYLSNVFHDRLHDMGFTEAAANFQLFNFDRGGVQGDRVQADVHDGNGLGPAQDNANFNTSGTDGSTARVQMYLWTGPSPARDGALDATIVFHELAHGLSIRLHGGLTNPQSRGLGEGWSDFFGLALNARAGDDPDGTYPVGAYAMLRAGGSAFTQNYYFGIRRAPYSTNLAIAPLTFADMDAGRYGWPLGVPMSPQVGRTISTSPGQEHNLGEVWCSMLLDARANLWRRHGFAGNQMMMRTVVDSMKLSPTNPTLVQARDAILLSDLITNGGTNRIELWTAFARRGAGAQATGPVSTGTNGVSESFARPATMIFEYPDGAPSVLEPGRANRFRVRVRLDNVFTIASGATLVYSINGGEEVGVPMVPLTPPSIAPALEDYRVDMPGLTGLACGSVVRYRISIPTVDGNRTDPPEAMPARVARVLTGFVERFRDGFETDSGWTVSSDPGVLGAWTRVTPLATSAAPGAAFEGSMCFVTGQGVSGGPAAASDLDNGKTVLTSPALDLSAYADVRVSYRRWFSNGVAPPTAPGSFEDVFRTQVSVDDGVTWTSAETVGPGPSLDTRPGWRAASFTLGELGLTPGVATRVRFIAEDAGNASTVEAGIDDFRIESATCSPPGCMADFDGSHTVSVDDLLAFLSSWFASDPRADVNRSGDVSVQDVFDFLTAFVGGC